MDLTQIIVNARRMLVAKFTTGGEDHYSATVMPIDPAGVPYGPDNSLAVADARHETHPGAQPVVVVPTTGATLAELLGGAIPAWATACRLYVGSASGIVYSTDGTPAAYAAPDATHGAPLDAADRRGHPIFGAASLAALHLIAMTADVKVTVELMG